MKKLLTILILISISLSFNSLAFAAEVGSEIQLDSIDERRDFNFILMGDIDFISLRFSYTDIPDSLFNNSYADITGGFNFALANDNRTRVLAGIRAKEFAEEMDNDLIIYSDTEQYITEEIFINPSVNFLLSENTELTEEGWIERYEVDSYDIKGLLGMDLTPRTAIKAGVINKVSGDDSDLGVTFALQIR